MKGLLNEIKKLTMVQSAALVPYVPYRTVRAVRNNTAARSLEKWEEFNSAVATKVSTFVNVVRVIRDVIQQQLGGG